MVGKTTFLLGPGLFSRDMLVSGRVRHALDGVIIHGIFMASKDWCFQAAKRPIRDVAVGTGEEVKVEGMVELLQCVAHTPADFVADFEEMEVPFR